MKSAIFLIAILFSFSIASSQEVPRKIFQYADMTQREFTTCPDSIINLTDQVLMLIDGNRSESALVLAARLRNGKDSCHGIPETYAWALFRSGEREAAAAIIDSAILVYGAHPELVLRRAYMNLEMAELGPGARIIDGNSVYKRVDPDVNDSMFRRGNYLAALQDFGYLADTYQNRYEEIYITGYIFQQLEEFEKSNDYLVRLINVEGYGDEISVVVAQNYTRLEKFEEAEKILLDLERNPFTTLQYENSMRTPLKGRFYAVGILYPYYIYTVSILNPYRRYGKKTG